FSSSGSQLVWCCTGSSTTSCPSRSSGTLPARSKRRPRQSDLRAEQNAPGLGRFAFPVSGETRMRPEHETIAAVATAPGRGGIGVVRVSGPRDKALAITLTGREPVARHAHYGPFHADDGEVIDEGLMLFFPGPHSFTGEDVLELQGHGGPVVMDMLLRRCVELGARLARPGEFSERAFLNDKLDLAQAEAIADLIEASSAQAALNAVRSLQGEFSRRVHQLTERLIQLRIYVEAAIDFP